MKTDIIKITPIEAADILSLHSNVRKVHQDTVRRYALDMKMGRWVHCHPQGLVFGTDGALVDGQHRLLAQVSAGIDIAYRATFDADSAVAETLDQGRGRDVSVALFGGHDRVGKNKVEILNALRFNVHRSSKRLSVYQAGDFLSKLDQRALTTIAVHTGKPRVPATVRAAFYLALAKDFELFEPLWQGFLAQNFVPSTPARITTFASLSAAAQERTSSRDAHLDVFSRLCGALHAYMINKPLCFAKANRSAVEFFSESLRSAA